MERIKMSNRFEDSFSYRLIYIFTIDHKTHKDALKIGETELKTNKSIEELTPNCKMLNDAAHKRIREYTNTVGVRYQLLHTELAVRYVKGVCETFRDHDVHDVLERSRIEKAHLANSREWFYVGIETAKRAIKAVKESRLSLNPNEIRTKSTSITFRPEQEEAIKKTKAVFRTRNRMLWNAKMRFGKTLTALELIRQERFHKTIIITHRPVVNAGWYEDYQKIFHKEEEFSYGSKNNGETIDNLIKSGKHFIYFASIQDLRGSEKVGGQHKKNEIIFNTKWDCVIVDEAHEGTQTVKGEDVMSAIVTEGTKFLALSGTPFNIMDKYEDNVYTWDYIMEQRCKDEWYIQNCGDSNPYADLPKMNIYVYDLGKLLGNKYVELEDKAFNFHEFFRVWTGDIKKDFVPIPNGSNVGDFVHADDILSFLNLITKEESSSNYPYSTKNYRDIFKHSLWKVPGVQEAHALSRMMKNHPVFSNFDIVNVAGDGDEEEKSEDALKKVRTAIKNAGADGYTITLTCGKLTTGVTVKEWNAVFMLAGSFSTSAASYLQTIFRVQSPCNIEGKFKDNCYVFDFAPDRTLKMVAESVALSTKAGKTNDSDRKILGEFLNFCPVIAIDGTVMREYETNMLLQQLKRAYAERTVLNGFDDNNLYNDELLKLNNIDLEEFNKLKRIIGSSKTQQKTKDININSQGFTDEEYDEIQRIEKKKKQTRTPEEQARLNELKEIKKNRDNAISILRGISIRMPLLIYGADIPIGEDFTLDKFLDDQVVDEASWREFMPPGVTKDVFKNFMKYYDQDVFIAAGRRIRNSVKGADELEPTERVQKLAQLFACFKNPDKETVLTPWRVVNLHISDCLGGYSFYGDNPPVNAQMLEQPRFVDKGQSTADTLCNINACILEINSKTGLYPLYVVYSIFRTRCAEYTENELSIEKQNELWEQTVRENIFIICKTPMAKFITKRTLIGYRNIPLNAHCFDDLINQFKNKSEQFIKRVSKGSFWNKGIQNMKFNAIVGNPPYQIMDGGNKNSSMPTYQHFVLQAKKLQPNYVSMIMPSRWFIGGKGLDGFRKEMLGDKRIEEITDYPDYHDVFPTVEIAGGVCYFLWNAVHSGPCNVRNVLHNQIIESRRDIGEFDVLVRDNRSIRIVRKVMSRTRTMKRMSDIVSPRKPFGLPTDYKEQSSGIPCHFAQKIGFKFAKPEDVDDSLGLIPKWKLLVPRAPIAGQTDFTRPVGFYYDGNIRISGPGECCTETWLVLNSFNTKKECLSFKSYILTKVVRFLLLQSVISQDVTRENFRFVPDLGTYKGQYSDQILCNMWNITENEWRYINSRIHNYDGQSKEHV